MGKKTTYTCDSCGHTIDPTYGPLRFSWSSDQEPHFGRSGEVCSSNCLLELMTRAFQLSPAIRKREVRMPRKTDKGWMNA